MIRADESLSTAASRAASPYPAGLELAHLKLIRDLAALAPHRIIGNADAGDLRDRGDHIRDVLAAVNGYVIAVAADTAHEAPCGAIDRRYVANMLTETASDVVAHMTRAATDIEADRAA